MSVHDKLKNPPCLEVALDIPDWRRVEAVIKALPGSEAVVIEVGTPLIKRYGVDVCRKIHGIKPDSGTKEARRAAEATADVCAYSGLAPIKTKEECRKMGILPYMDTINVEDPDMLVMGKAVTCTEDINRTAKPICRPWDIRGRPVQGHDRLLVPVFLHGLNRLLHQPTSDKEGGIL